MSVARKTPNNLIRFLTKSQVSAISKKDESCGMRKNNRNRNIVKKYWDLLLEEDELFKFMTDNDDIFVLFRDGVSPRNIVSPESMNTK